MTHPDRQEIEQWEHKALPGDSVAGSHKKNEMGRRRVLQKPEYKTPGLTLSE